MLKRLITKLIILANLVNFNFYCSNTYQIRYSETLEDVAGKFTIECEENNKYKEAAGLIEEHGDLNKEYAPIYIIADTSKIIQYVKEFEFENCILSFYNSRNNKKSILKNNPIPSSFLNTDHLESKITKNDTSLILVENNLSGIVIYYIERLNGKNIKFSDKVEKEHQELFEKIFVKGYPYLIELDKK